MGPGGRWRRMLMCRLHALFPEAPRPAVCATEVFSVGSSKCGGVWCCSGIKLRTRRSVMRRGSEKLTIFLRQEVENI